MKAAATCRPYYSPVGTTRRNHNKYQLHACSRLYHY